MPTWPELVAEELEKQEQTQASAHTDSAWDVYQRGSPHLTSFEIQVRFRHTCPGDGCAICRWVRTHPVGGSR